MTTPTHTRTLRSTSKYRFILGLTLVLATVALYYPVCHYQFVSYDDGLYITDNWHVKYGLSWTTVRWAFTAQYADNWHPLTWLSHGLDSSLSF
jgi:protein O-mannosyl-transferase